MFYLVHIEGCQYIAQADTPQQAEAWAVECYLVNGGWYYEQDPKTEEITETVFESFQSLAEGLKSIKDEEGILPLPDCQQINDVTNFDPKAVKQPKPKKIDKFKPPSPQEYASDVYMGIEMCYGNKCHKVLPQIITALEKFKI